jgi:transglutaminase-like putative cysteine protease
VSDAAQSLRTEPWLSTVLRVIVHAVTAGVIAYPLTVVDGVVAAALGSGLGALLARVVARSALRIPSILGAGVGALVGVTILRFAVVDLSLVPELLGPSGALIAGDAVVFGLGGLVVSTVLRAVSTRRPALSVLEAALVAGGFATLLVAHRNGAIHRPYEIADPLIARGEDPALAILLIGAGGAVVIGLLLLSERSVVRSVFHLAVVAVLLLGILFTTSMEGLPTPPPGAGALNLQDGQGEGGSSTGGGQGSAQGGQGQRRDSEELEFRDQAPGGSPAPDAVIIFHEDYSSPTGYYYFRQGAFSQYNGRKLVTALRDDVDRDVRNVFPTTQSREVGWAPQVSEDRMAVETTVALLADNSAPIGLEAPARFVPATNPNPQRFQRLYRAHSNALTADYEALFGRDVGDPTWSEEVRALYLAGPDDPRYRRLAERIVGALPEELRGDPVAKALAITQYLGVNGTYSLRSNHAGAEDPTADFLFGDLTGYCVHFAHAAVYLMRAAGVPARVGTGYAVAEANRQGGSAILLRNSDQHAWPEVYVGAARVPPPIELVALQMYADGRANHDLEGFTAEELQVVVRVVMETAAAQHGWARTPAREARLWSVLDSAAAEQTLESIASESGQPVDQLLRAAIARVEALPRLVEPDAGWVVMDVAPQNVLDPPGEPPDPALQQLLAEMARGSQPLEDAPQPPRPMAELVRQMQGPFVLAIELLVAALFLFVLGAKLWRALAPSVSATPRNIYRAALDRLSESGLSRRWGESPEAFAARVQRELPALRTLTNGHLAAAFGRHRDPKSVGAMMQAYRATLRELARAVPWWRRALGWINPFSWLFTR